MESIKRILEEFNPISLQEMDSVVLMDRTDLKYIFHYDQLPQILQRLKDDYRVLSVLGNRISKYESLYFDTEKFDPYYNHHRGRHSRFKVRFRSYVESNLHFFEVKFRNRKGRTIKDRIVQGGVQQVIVRNAEEFLHEKTPLQAATLEPKFWVNYSRITLVNKNGEERVTIDVNLNFKKKESDEDLIVEDLVIAEVKQDKAFISPFIKVMKNHMIRRGSLSKYCYGVTLLFREKYNNFKPGIILLNKIRNGTITGTAHR